jgi:hypothetical protein
MTRRLHYLVWSLLTLPLVAFVMLAARNPDGFSRTFLRTGGRFVIMATGKPKLIAALLALAVAAAWGSIVVACVLENWRSKRQAGRR